MRGCYGRTTGWRMQKCETLPVAWCQGLVPDLLVSQERGFSATSLDLKQRVGFLSGSSFRVAKEPGVSVTLFLLFLVKISIFCTLCAAGSFPAGSRWELTHAHIHTLTHPGFFASLSLKVCFLDKFPMLHLAHFVTAEILACAKPPLLLSKECRDI